MWLSISLPLVLGFGFMVLLRAGETLGLMVFWGFITIVQSPEVAISQLLTLSIFSVGCWGAPVSVMLVLFVVLLGFLFFAGGLNLLNCVFINKIF